ncbi:nuclear transport factor 2 family protein [Allosalinactinospora lopnorensis]|uniref:nuclear transport factor 2 family protein n=1 Tax=Allosalinactinospora lopnorensis TaxID=1352348 RepID=UPI000623D18D|nr:nuclear transport factor 2 family protein [Allosalinactinospora lopnorensis]
MPTNSEIVRKFYADANRNDLDALLTVMAHDVEWTLPIGAADHGVGNVKGHEGFRALFTGGQRLFSEQHRIPEEVIESGDRVAVFGSYHLRGAQSGVASTMRFAQYFRIVDGTVRNVAVYWDSADMLRALEAAPAEP